MGTLLTRDATAVTRALWSAIQSGKDGETVDALGRSGLPRYGYYVGGRSWTLVRAASNVTPDDVAGFVSANDDASFYGMWVDGGRVYIDAVDLIYSTPEAFRIARERCELSIFNISTGECQEV